VQTLDQRRRADLEDGGAGGDHGEGRLDAGCGVGRGGGGDEAALQLVGGGGGRLDLAGVLLGGPLAAAGACVVVGARTHNLVHKRFKRIHLTSAVVVLLCYMLNSYLIYVNYYF
jgi:hypothetical protein